MLIFLLGYVVLDWASYIHPLHGLNITPWNPAPALGLVFLLRFGKTMLLPLALAILSADIGVRHLPAALPITILLALVLTTGYGLIAAVLRRFGHTTIFNDRYGLFQWVVIITLGTLLNSAVFVGALTIAHLIPYEEMGYAFLRYAIGDSVGVLVTMPVLWLLIDESGRARLRLMVLQHTVLWHLVLTACALWVAFGLGAQADFKYFYVLFLPMAWAAARQGLTGALLSATLIQGGIISAAQSLGFSTVTVLEIQLLAVVLVLFGFFLGVVVDEQKRISVELNQTLRLAAAGEMTGALAHELNQPLTALSAYGTACEQLLEQGETGACLRDTIHRMVAESFRAAEVLRRLRDFFRTGATQLESVAINDLLHAVTHSFKEKAQQQQIQLRIDDVPACLVCVDRLQMEVVLRNLLSNAFDAVAEQVSGTRQIRFSAQVEGAGRICICIEDSGPGLSAATAARLFEAFQSTKSSGLGLGLAISRAIVEAHGGQLWAEVTGHGVFKLLLPVESEAHHASA